ncbi:LysE family translocator [Oceanicola sp. 22II-s10i]|uniref:LysE family translocator n=1 Tax=Oceanicola sp. 22II-s10i TaxID=1317116 RepID=UPI0015955EE7|nr:LysE family transporter [Oceanicola sp. 22II-s10i]
MTPEIWITLAAANFAAYLAPGQNVALVGAATARGGLFGGLVATGGILVAELIWAAIALALTLTAREVADGVLLGVQLGGGAFLVWSGARMLRAPAVTVANRVPSVNGALRLAALGTWGGLANPLALIFFVSIFPGLIGSIADEPPAQLLVFCGSAVVLSSFAALTPYLAASQVLVKAGGQKLLKGLSGGALLCVGLAAIALGAAW